MRKLRTLVRWWYDWRSTGEREKVFFIFRFFVLRIERKAAETFHQHTYTEGDDTLAMVYACVSMCGMNVEEKRTKIAPSAPAHAHTRSRRKIRKSRRRRRSRDDARSRAPKKATTAVEGWRRWRGGSRCRRTTKNLHLRKRPRVWPPLRRSVAVSRSGGRVRAFAGWRGRGRKRWRKRKAPKKRTTAAKTSRRRVKGAAVEASAICRRWAASGC